MASPRRKLKTALIALIALGLMVATIPAAVWLTHTQTAQVGNSELRCQNVRQRNHRVVFHNNQLIPDHIVAKLCDTLTFTNQDATPRLVAFGPHEHHISYDGVSERLLDQGQSLTITLIKKGTFSFHDHIHDELQGSFTVN